MDAAITTASQNPTENQDLLEILRELDEQAHQGGDIIRALRGFIRKDDGEISEFDLRILISQTCHLMRHEAEVWSVNLEYVIGDFPKRQRKPRSDSSGPDQSDAQCESP